MLHNIANSYPVKQKERITRCYIAYSLERLNSYYHKVALCGKQEVRGTEDQFAQIRPQNWCPPSQVWVDKDPSQLKGKILSKQNTIYVESLWCLKHKKDWIIKISPCIFFPKFFWFGKINILGVKIWNSDMVRMFRISTEYCKQYIRWISPNVTLFQWLEIMHHLISFKRFGG